MEAWELAAVVVSLTAIFLVGVLVYVVTKLHSTISQVQKFLNRMNETTIATDLDIASKSKAVEAEIQRIKGIATQRFDEVVAHYEREEEYEDCTKIIEAINYLKSKNG